MALRSAIYSLIALFFALNRIFFLSNENETEKKRQAFRFQGFLNEPITLQENERQKVRCLINLAIFVVLVDLVFRLLNCMISKWIK